MSTPGSRVRWVGFDLDECLGSFMPLWPYCEDIATVKQSDIPESSKLLFHNQLIVQLAETQLKTRSTTWMFRPEIETVLYILNDLQLQGKITGCFILSNNAGPRLVRMIRQIFNYKIWLLRGASNPFEKSPDLVDGLFLADWSRLSVCRKGHGEDKSWDVVQQCLQSKNLPTMTDKSDLLFFDDLASHKLHTKDKIPYYIQVPPYTHHTPADQMWGLVKPLLDKYAIPFEVQEMLYLRGVQYDATYSTKRQQVPPPSSNIVRDYFHKAISVFVSEIPFTSEGGGVKRVGKTRIKRRTIRHPASGRPKKQTRGLWKRY
jgi:hypothetical protein